jgi:hypothetical protein
MYEHDVLRLCTLSHVCWDAAQDQMVLVVAGTPGEVTRTSAALDDCRATPTFGWCKCIMGATSVTVRRYDCSKTQQSSRTCRIPHTHARTHADADPHACSYSTAHINNVRGWAPAQ